MASNPSWRWSFSCDCGDYAEDLPERDVDRLESEHKQMLHEDGTAHEPHVFLF